MAGLLGFTLADLSGAVDSRKRQYANLVRGLLSDPGATLAQLAAVDAEAARGNRYTQMSAGSVMPEVAQQGQEAMLNAAMNVGGLLGMTSKAKPPEYGIAHRPMTDEGGAARLHDLSKSFGDDIYGPNALQYFGSGDKREREVLNILRKVRNNPDAEVTIYRGIPADAAGEIHKGDWVTLSPSVAKDYGPNVVKRKVKASEITSWADSLLEFGYYPHE